MRRTIEDDVAKALGLPPHNHPGNYVNGDPYFDKECAEHWGQEAWADACAAATRPAAQPAAPVNGPSYDEWRIDEPQDGGNKVAIRTQGEHVADVYGFSAREILGRARLMRAAPSMLAVLRTIVRQLEQEGPAGVVLPRDRVAERARELVIALKGAGS